MTNVLVGHLAKEAKIGDVLVTSRCANGVILKSVWRLVLTNPAVAVEVERVHIQVEDDVVVHLLDTNQFQHAFNRSNFDLSPTILRCRRLFSARESSFLEVDQLHDRAKVIVRHYNGVNVAFGFLTIFIITVAD